MQDRSAFAIAVIIFLATIRALVIGSASVSGDYLTRKEQPIIYWAVIGVAVIVIALLLGKSLIF